MIFHQECVTLRPRPRGCHLVTNELLEGIPEITEISRGFLHVFIQHTSASLTLNENADPDVRRDMETALNLIAREDFPFVHTMEGPDDMPAHVKASLLGSSLTIPVRDGHLAVGTWQGIYLCEHRDHGGPRRFVLSAWGVPVDE